MVQMIPVLVTAFTAVAVLAYADRLAGSTALQLANHLGMPAESWLLSPFERHVRRFGCTISLALPVVGVLTVGWLRGLAVFLAAAIVCYWLTTRSPSAAGPRLVVAVARARARALTLRNAGDATSANAAEELAQRIDRFRRQNPELTLRDIAHLPERRRPTEVADLLESWWEGRVTGVYADDADLGLPDWLKSQEWTPFPGDRTEQDRLELLERVKQELIAGGGTRYADETRLATLVAELRAFVE